MIFKAFYKWLCGLFADEKVLRIIGITLVILYNLNPNIAGIPDRSDEMFYAVVAVYFLSFLATLLLPALMLLYNKYGMIHILVIIGFLKSLFFSQHIDTAVFFAVFVLVVFVFVFVRKRHDEEREIARENKKYKKIQQDFPFREYYFEKAEPEMNTIIDTLTSVPAHDTVIYKDAARLLTAGEVVALPTETVYGLAANALDCNAIEKIFSVKGRPRDNPLIVHVTDMDMVRNLGLEVPELAHRLAEKFWPGPLTFILNKRAYIIPDEVSCGLKTVAVRAPDNSAALEIIKLCEFPLAMPSANISGSPSPTMAEHVYADLKGRIPLIIDGGACRVGLESTVIAFEGERVRILRPGAVTPEQLRDFAEVAVDDTVPDVPQSPGTKHKHYSPKAKVIAVITDSDEAFAAEAGGDFTIAEPEAHTLFARLRELDELGAERIYVRLPKPELGGINLAVYNRLIRAAEFNIIKL